jgi:hypothetical protein
MGNGSLDPLELFASVCSPDGEVIPHCHRLKILQFRFAKRSLTGLFEWGESTRCRRST